MQIAPFRIWTRVTEFISYDFNFYTKHASKTVIILLVIIFFFKFSLKVQTIIIVSIRDDPLNRWIPVVTAIPEDSDASI